MVATLFLLLAALSPCARATVTNVAWYRLGENDPGAASGLAVLNTTTDSLGANHLQEFGGPRYTDAVSADAASRIGSALAVQFNGASQFLSNALVSTARDNFGIEAWVKPNSTSGASTPIAYNGAGPNGWGLFQSGSQFSAVFGGVTIFDLGPVAIGTWSHLALVRDGGTTKLYFNGAAVGTSTTPPNAPTVGFELGARVQPVFVEFFNGAIDEVRVFHFAAGQFSTNDLLVNARRGATLPATGVGPTNATLNGSANPVGFATRVWFEWGTTTNYGNVTPPQALGSGSGETNFSETLTGLIPGVSYHFRAAASNSVGVVFGSDQSFRLPVFAETGSGLPGVQFCSVAWGDYDSDGRLDLLLTGATTNGLVAQIWRNTGNGFTNINANTLGPVSQSSVAWGDYDNDARLDFLEAGDAFGFSVSLVWRNTTNGFGLALGANLTGVSQSSVAWGDYDNDGRLDFLLTGATKINNFIESIESQLWRNTGNGFTEINAGLPGVFESSVAWGDYDNDGRLDFLLTGRTNQDFATGISQVWRNTGTGFTNINAGLPGVYQSSVAWGDYDSDGWLDILLAGTTGPSFISQVWRNTGNGFTNINAGLPGVFQGSAAWGDYDNDGRLDILLTGEALVAGGFISEVWRNTGSGFANIKPSLPEAGLPGVFTSSAAWGDYDNDGRLDILLAGASFETGGEPVFPISQVWRNHTPLTNTPPTAPIGLAATLLGDDVILSWSAASDAQTPASGLSYNLRIGTTPGAADVMGPMASSSGLRRLPQMGNAQLGLTALFKHTLGTAYYWSVQAVDSAFAGSPFSAESSLRVLQLPQPAPVMVPTTTTNLLNGDLDGDGVFGETELQTLLADFFSSSPFLQMTNVAGLGGTNVTFALSNSLAGAFSVEFTTNLMDWLFLGPAIPRYEFTDTNAPAEPQRYYRLRWP